MLHKGTSNKYFNVAFESFHFSMFYFIRTFLSFKFAKFDYSTQEIYSLVINLFLSMLPLHYEDSRKQLALLANALRLYSEYLKIR